MNFHISIFTSKYQIEKQDAIPFSPFPLPLFPHHHSPSPCSLSLTNLPLFFPFPRPSLFPSLSQTLPLIPESFCHSVWISLQLYSSPTDVAYAGVRKRKHQQKSADIAEHEFYGANLESIQILACWSKIGQNLTIWIRPQRSHNKTKPCLYCILQFHCDANFFLMFQWSC